MFSAAERGVGPCLSRVKRVKDTLNQKRVRIDPKRNRFGVCGFLRVDAALVKSVDQNSLWAQIFSAYEELV